MPSNRSGGRLEVLVFEVARWRFGVPSSDVRELLRAVTIVPLPKAPAVVEGIIDVRGTIVPVLDIRSRFRLPGKAVEHSDHLLVARAGERLVALRVDRALDLARVGADEIEEAARIAPGVEYVAGVAKLPDGLVLIHDLRTFLSQAESAALDRSLAGRAGEGETA
jgi:purine-binding chemotaxis protein CheW